MSRTGRQAVTALVLGIGYTRVHAPPRVYPPIRYLLDLCLQQTLNFPCRNNAVASSMERAAGRLARNLANYIRYDNAILRYATRARVPTRRLPLRGGFLTHLIYSFSSRYLHGW